MLEGISKYTYIRDTMFGDGPRVTIDTDVLGTRDQKRIKRNVDQYYLKEIKSMYETYDLSNSIEFKYPIDLNEALPKPALTKYVDQKKLEELNADVQDVFKYTGGDDPDVDSLYEKYEELRQDHHDKLSSIEEDKEKKLSTLYNTLSTDLQSNQNQISSLEATLSSIYKEHDNAVSSQLSDYLEDLSALDQKKIDINEKRAKGEIELSTWNEQRQDLENQYYELELDNFLENYKIDCEHYGNLAEYNQSHYDLFLERKSIQKEYDDNLAEELSSYNNKLSSENETYNKAANEIYLQSNGYTGQMYFENGDQLRKDIADLSVYNATANIRKKIPWLSDKDAPKYIEYNNRLFADWEKCVVIKPDFYNMWKDVKGIMEHYSSYANFPAYEGPEGVTVPAVTYRDSFDRWLGGDMVAYEIKYLPGEDAGQTSSIKIISNQFTARFGNRHQVDHVKKLHLILTAEGTGEEDGHGRVYKHIEATFDRLLAEKWLIKFDEEDDLNLKNLQKIEDDYMEERGDVLLEQAEEEYQLKIDYQKDQDDIDSDLESRIRSRTQAWVSGLNDVMIQSNTLKAEGEDNSAQLQQISESKSKYLEDIDKMRQQAYKDKDDLSEEYREKRRETQKKYEEKLEELTDQWKIDKEEEDERHSKAVKKIQDDYYEDYQNQSDAIYDEFNDAVDKAAKTRKDGWDAMEESDKQFDKGMAEDWNNKFKDEPDYDDFWKVSEEYRFTKDGVPAWSTPGSEINKWIAQSIWLAITNRQIANGQQSDKLQDEYNTAVAQASQTREEKLGKLESLDRNARGAFTFSGSSLADFIGEFSAEPKWSEIGIASVGQISILAIFAEMDYKANTGKEYDDYEELDNPEEDEEESDNN